jgi:hypothetical protein
LTKLPKTALTVGFVWLLAALWNSYRTRWLTAEVLAGIGIALILIGLVPAGARAFHGGWMKLAAALGYVNSRILLSFVYLAVLTPYGLTLRLFGRDSLNRRRAPQPSYWIPKTATRQRKDQFERLF